MTGTSQSGFFGVYPMLLADYRADSELALPPFLHETRGELDIFVGLAGPEAPEVLRAGATGLIPGFETLDHMSEQFDCLQEGRDEDAEAVCRSIELALVFMLKSINHFVTYSREVAGRRLGHEAIHHQLGVDVSPLGLSIAKRFARQFGPL
jgi:hypothetical protein